MQRLAKAALIAACLAVSTRAAEPAGAWLDAYREPASRILEATRGDRTAWDRLAELTDTFGHRLSGSAALEAALPWAEARMKQDGLENVRLEKVKVPRWMRGQESLSLVEPFPTSVVMLGLGGSVGTPEGGIQAEVLVVSGYEELERRAAEAKGRIVLYNVAFTNYGETVRYRGEGASRAAKLGAVASLLRSVGPTGLRTPHTGALRYDEKLPRIPAAAISAEDAERLQRIAARGQRIVARLSMEAHVLPDSDSANVVGEIRGRELPNEVVVVGGHIDSWDVGAGAMDDGGGCVATWDALRVLHKLGLRPRRTLRVVLFTNEENGLRGGLGYRDQHADELKDHVMALESDGGVFRPLGFGFTGSEEGRARVQAIASLLAPIGATRVDAGGGGADVGPLAEAGHVPTMSPIVEGERYFIYHHTPSDTIERLDPEDVRRNIAAIAVMAYVVADLPERLGR